MITRKFLHIRSLHIPFSLYRCMTECLQLFHFWSAAPPEGLLRGRRGGNLDSQSGVSLSTAASEEHSLYCFEASAWIGK